MADRPQKKKKRAVKVEKNFEQGRKIDSSRHKKMAGTVKSSK